MGDPWNEVEHAALPQINMQTFTPGFSKRKFKQQETNILVVLHFEKPFERNVFLFNLIRLFFRERTFQRFLVLRVFVHSREKTCKMKMIIFLPSALEMKSKAKTF